jgi:uncharacterized membrane protein YuzA (DUF378 family)
MVTLCYIIWALVFVGGLNWGLVGLGGLFSQNWNLVNLLFGSWPTLEAIIYILVGLAAIGMIFTIKCPKK